MDAVRKKKYERSIQKEQMESEKNEGDRNQEKQMTH